MLAKIQNKFLGALSKVPSFLRKYISKPKRPNLAIKCEIARKNWQKKIDRFFLKYSVKWLVLQNIHNCPLLLKLIVENSRNTFEGKATMSNQWRSTGSFYSRAESVKLWVPGGVNWSLRPEEWSKKERKKTKIKWWIIFARYFGLQHKPLRGL